MVATRTVEFDVKVTGYWQVCPVCGGRGTVPQGFYSRMGVATSTAVEQCRRCIGTGTIVVPTAEARPRQDIETPEPDFPERTPEQIAADEQARLDTLGEAQTRQQDIADKRRRAQPDGRRIG